MTLLQIEEVIKGIREGKQIQERKRNTDIWYDISVLITDTFNLEYFEWRVKPNPREFWITSIPPSSRKR